MFNSTNLVDYVGNQTTIIMHVQEIGPYVFLENQTKTNLVWHPNGTLTFNIKREWFFQEDRSNGSLTDILLQLSPWYFKKMADVKWGGPLDYASLNLHDVREERMNQIHEDVTFAHYSSVNSLLFEGQSHDLEGVQFNKKFGISLYEDPKYKTVFGWYLQRNGSEDYDGVFNMYTDKPDVDQLGIINLWNRQSKSKAFTGNCDSITGTLGDLWPPILFKKKLSIFDPDICSCIPLKPQVGDKLVKGVKGRLFIPNAPEMDNQIKHGRQSCYGSLKPGLRNITTCKSGIPTFVSFPHFYLADPSYQTKLTGLNPSADKNEYRIILEPNTGTLLQLDIKLQINLYIDIDIDSTNEYEFYGFKERLLPMYWYHLHTVIADDYAEELGDMVHKHEVELGNTQDICLHVGFPLMIIGSVLVCISLSFMSRTAYLKSASDGNEAWTVACTH